MKRGKAVVGVPILIVLLLMMSLWSTVFVELAKADGIDNSPPLTLKSIGDPCYGDDEKTLIWVTSKTEFNLTAVDDGSGVKATYYRIWFNGTWTEWMKYSGNFTLKGECIHYIEWYSVDNVGNKEEVHNQTHYVDNTSPAITKTIGKPQYYDGEVIWVTSNTPFTISAYDYGVEPCVSGVKATYYRIWYNGVWTAWKKYLNPFLLEGECTHYIEYYSIDFLGNKKLHNQTHYVDDTPPVTTKEYGADSDNGIWDLLDTQIKLNATDRGVCPVGVNATYYRVWYNGSWTPSPGSGVDPTGNFSEYVEPFTVHEEGISYIEWYSIDHLGNTECIHNQTVGWINYTMNGEVVRDQENLPEDKDVTNGGADVSEHQGSGDFASGVEASGGGAENNPGDYASAQYRWHVPEDDSTDCYLFIRMRLVGDPLKSGKGLYDRSHWDALIDIDNDGFKEFVVDLDGVNGAFAGGTLGVYYNDLPTQEYDPNNETQVIWIKEASDDSNTNTRVEIIIYEGDCKNQYWLEFAVPLIAFNVNGEQLLSPDSEFQFYFSTSASNTDPLQKDWMTPIKIAEDQNHREKSLANTPRKLIGQFYYISFSILLTTLLVATLLPYLYTTSSNRKKKHYPKLNEYK